jgi:two-component sensor histidine kinase
LQANAVDDPQLSDRLNEASSRISTVGRAYERLAYDADHEKIGLVGYIREVLKDLEVAVTPCQLLLEAPEEIQFAADRAILVALIINELVLNAAKHAYPDRSGKMISVRAVQSDQTSLLVSVRDHGVGLPPGFDPATSKRLGTRLVTALARQLDAELTHPVSPSGTDFTLLVPLEPGLSVQRTDQPLR